MMRVFVVAPCMLIVLSPLFVQLMHTNYYKIVKKLKSFKIITVAPTCFGLHKPSSGSSQPVHRQSYNVDFGYISLFQVIGIVTAYIVQSRYARGSCTVWSGTVFGKAQAESSLMMVYVNRNMLEQLL